MSWPSDAGRGCWDDEDLPRACRDRLLYLLDAAPFGRQQKQRLAVRAAQHGGEDRAIVFDPLQHLAALADPHDRPWRIGMIAGGCWTQMAPSASMQMASGPRPSAQTRRLDRLPSAAMSKAVSRPAKDSEMISVALSGVTTMPLGNARSSATMRAVPSGVTSAMIPDVGGLPARNPNWMLVT